MLFYLINVVDSTWILFLGFPLIYFVGLRDQNPRWRKRIFLAFVTLGIIAALTYAILKLNTGWVVREKYDLFLLWPSLALLIIYLICLKKALSTRGQGVVGRVAGYFLLGLMIARVVPDLIIYPVNFDVGMDSIFNLDYLAKVTGYLSGLCLMVLMTFGFFWLIKRVPKNLLFPLILISLLIIFVYLSVHLGRIFLDRNMLPRALPILAKIIFFFLIQINIFLYTEIVIWGIAAALVLIFAIKTVPTGANPALVRKSRYATKLQTRSAIFVFLILTGLFTTITYLRYLESRGPFISEPEEVTLDNGVIALDLKIVGDGNLHRYVYKTTNGINVRFIVIRKTESAFGVGLDACDICGPTGYYQRGDQVICRLCDVVMNKSTIGFPGGCNPVPLAFRVENEKLIIDPIDLENEERRFE
ncbi:MAG: DUF2318 domain-containing protein [Deltaproteobacteria bacterium]|jgi:uncharacterized membrane protein|nr:DUF2318 domain-containing protein [Deltaproteobacteria bacterium]